MYICFILNRTVETLYETNSTALFHFLIYTLYLQFTDEWGITKGEGITVGCIFPFPLVSFFSISGW